MFYIANPRITKKVKIIVERKPNIYVSYITQTTYQTLEFS